jgi:CheY-like chemotaxis protein
MDAEAPASGNETHADAGESCKHSILIVDDRLMNRKLSAAILAAEDRRIVTAENGAQALACVAQAPPDLILLDMLMPGMSGLEVLKRLKADAATAQISVIMLTGMADHETVTRALDAGADECLYKPVDPDELILRVQNMLLNNT